MEHTSTINHIVAVVGGGPAGIFAARELASNNVHVVIFNRDIKPGGLAEYGIYPDKLKMKKSLRAQFQQILTGENITYYGNAAVGNHTGLSLDDLRAMGFQALLVTAGAQATKWVGLPGEDLRGVYHAKEIVYHYNKLPPYGCQEPLIGKRVAVVGVGNVMMDIARYLISQKRVDEVIGVARRGPADVKFNLSEVESVAANLDMQALAVELARTAPFMQAVNQDSEKAGLIYHQALGKALPSTSNTRLSLQFLASPFRVLDDENGGVGGLMIEDNTLHNVNGETRPRGLGTFRQLDVDTVIFAVGDSVDPDIGLPMDGSEFCKRPEPRFPIEGVSFEACDPARRMDVSYIFIAGWARKASSGLVGIARRDGVNVSRAILQYLDSTPPVEHLPIQSIQEKMQQLSHPVATIEDVAMLERIECERAEALNLNDYCFCTNEEMLEVVGKKYA